MSSNLRAWGWRVIAGALFFAATAAVVAPVVSPVFSPQEAQFAENAGPSNPEVTYLSMLTEAAPGDSVSGTFASSTALQVSATLQARVGAAINIVLTAATSSSTAIVLENRTGGGAAWTPIKSYSTATSVNDTINNDFGSTLFLRLRANTIPAADTVTYTLARVIASRTVQEWLGNNGQSVLRITDVGVISPQGNFTSIVGRVTGTADSATGSARAAKLTTARTINGTSFDGSANVTVTAAAGTLTGNTLNSSVVSSTLSTLGTVTALSAGTGVFSGTLTPQGLVDASGASAGQFKFPATQNASANANTLDDYQEAPWTPTLVGWTNVGTPTVTGTVTKIGRLVFLTILIVPGTSVLSTAGTSTIENLPYTPAVDAASVLGANDNSGISYGGGSILTNAKILPPGTGGAVTNRVIVSAFFITAN